MTCQTLCSNCFKKVTHVIFDLDGTLMDTETCHHKAYSEVCAFYGKEYTEEVRNAHVGTPTYTSCQIIKDILDIDASKEEIAEKFFEIAFSCFPEAKLLPGAEKLVHHLYDNKVPIAIATASIDREYKEKHDTNPAFFDLFDHYVLNMGPEVGSGKPAPDIFLVAAKRFAGSPKPEKCLVVEDSSTGVKAAKNANMQCVLVPSKEFPEEILKMATLVLDSLELFKPEVFGLPPYT